SLKPLKRVLIERTEGNPFFLEETVQTLVETGTLIGDRGAYRLTEAPEAWQIPATVQAILAARIDRLPPEDKPLLQAASVIGKDVPFTLLQAIADVPEESLRRGLTTVQAAEFLYETSVFPDLEYTALHPLPDTRQKVECAIDLRLDLRQALFPLNELAIVWRYLQEAEGLARTLDDPRRLGWVSAYMSGHHLHTGGHATEVRTLAQRVEAIAERLGDVPLQIAAQYYLAAASYLSGDYRATEHACQ